MVLTASEKKRFPPPGKMVQVEGAKLHIYTEGSGQTNVVLLEGWGTAAPTIDFKPLLRALKNGFRVSIVEYPGYGWSEGTNSPRTNQNIVEEIRSSLRGIGVLPPYVIICHSISGLYTLHYSIRYPNEIRAIIGLDSTVPEQFHYWHPKRLSALPQIARATGILRLLVLLDPKIIGYQYEAYSDEDRRKFQMMYCWNHANRTQRAEYRQVSANAKELDSQRFPSTIPIRMIVSKDSIVSLAKTMKGLDWKKAHENIIAGNLNGRVIVLDAGHFIEWDRSDIVADIVQEMTSSEGAGSRK
jgi:pimeloyl-ACP methyl ester carboxylesterase